MRVLKEGNAIFITPRKLSQYAVTTLASVHHQLIIKLKFRLKHKEENIVTKVGASAGSQQPSDQQSGSQEFDRVSYRPRQAVRFRGSNYSGSLLP